MIPGTFPLLGGGAGKQAVFTQSSSSSVAASSYTFSNVSLGVYDPTRVIVLAVHWFRYDTSASLSSATIGANATTSRVSTSRLVTGGSGSYVYCALRTVVMTGTSANVSLTFNIALNYGCAIGVWALYNVGSSVPVDTDTADTNGLFALSVQPDDLVIAAATAVYDQTSATWVNATENYEAVTSRMLSTGANRQPFITGDPGVDFNINYASNAIPVGVAGVWR